MEIINRVYPDARESRFSYMYRLAQCNYVHPAEAIKCGGSTSTLYIDNHNYDTGSDIDKAIDAFLHSACDDTDVLKSNQFDKIMLGRASTRYERKHLYFQTFLKYCPLCWKKVAYHRVDWDVTWKAVCEDHNTFLIQMCPFCHRKIYPTKLMAGVCYCGTRYDEFPVHVAPEPILMVQATIHELLGGMVQSIEVDGEVFSTPGFFIALDKEARSLEGTPLSAPVFEGFEAEGWLAHYLVRSGGTREPKMMAWLAAAAYRRLANTGK